MRRAIFMCVVLAAVCALPAGSASATPRYGLGDTALFGTIDSGGNYWNGNSNTNISDDGSSGATAISMRFTSRGVSGVNAIGLRLVGWDTVSDTVTLGLQADNGSGIASGTWLAKYSGAPINDREVFALDNTVSLTAGSVYHVVVEPTVTATYGRVYHGRRSAAPPELQTVTPIELATDPSWNIMVNYVDPNMNGGGWQIWGADPNLPHEREPAFGLYDGITALSEGSTSVALSNYSSLRYSVQRAGQTFGISDEVISPGQKLQVDSVWLKASSTGSPVTNCLVSITTAADPNTVLATATITPAQADGALREYALDNAIQLEQGVDYLFLSDFAGTEAGNTVYYKFYVLYAGYTSVSGDPDDSAGTYGGADYCNVKQAWADTGYVTENTERDWAFLFEGTVVPEPMTLGLMALGGLALLHRRRR